MLQLSMALTVMVIYIIAVYLSIAGLLDEDILLFISPILMLPIMRYTLNFDVIKWYSKSASFLIYVSHGMIVGIVQPLLYRMFIKKLGLLRTYILCIIAVATLEILFLLIMKFLSRFKIVSIFSGGR